MQADTSIPFTDLQEDPGPSAKVAELLDVIDAAEIGLEELLELTLCNLAELASAYEDAGTEAAEAEAPDLHAIGYTTAALTRLQIAANTLAELLPGDDDDDEEDDGDLEGELTA